MSKAANIYWDSSNARRPTRNRANTVRKRSTPAAVRRPIAPWWVSFLIVTSIFAMLLLSINVRTFTQMREEADLNSRLAVQIQNLMDENLALQDEIHALKTDPAVIQREARRIGIDPASNKVPVPAN